MRFRECFILFSMCFHWHNDDLFFSCQKSSLTWIISLFHSTSSCETLTLCLTCYVTLYVSGLNWWQRWICDLADWFMCDLLTVMGCLNAESVVQTGGVLHVCGSLNWWHWCVNIVTYYITVLHYYVMLCGVFEPDSVVSRAVKSYVMIHGTGLRSWWKWIHDFPCIFYDFFKHLTSFWNIWMKFCSHLDRCVFCW